jgi:Mlc titration factor MtfA (ptsG expression regulator)
MIVTPEIDRRNRIRAVAAAAGWGIAAAAVAWILLARSGGEPPLALPAALLVAAGAFWLTRRRVRRRLRVMRQPFPEAWERILRTHVAYFRALDEEKRERFRQIVRVFLDEVRITGIRTDVDETSRVLVAASAAIPILGFPEWEYSRLGEVLLYPAPFDGEYRTDGSPDANALGMVGTEHLGGVMILSKPDLLHGFDDPGDRLNVGIHEFAHLVDREEGTIDGAPSGDPRAVRSWRDHVRAALAGALERSGDIRRYGFTNEMEFFAVLSEYFFESPDLLERRHPDLYRLLRDLYHQDSKATLSSLPAALRQARRRKIGRNAPCPCGSGRKYKKCCLRKTGA